MDPAVAVIAQPDDVLRTVGTSFMPGLYVVVMLYPAAAEGASAFLLVMDKVIYRREAFQPAVLEI